MSDGGALNAAELFQDDPSELFIDLGQPDYNRRLSDKILAAFNHAYSVGETEVAAQLKVILTQVEHKGKVDYPQRRGFEATGQAELWVAFVSAREDYKALTEREVVSADELDVALGRMKDTYRAWNDKV